MKKLSVLLILLAIIICFSSCNAPVETTANVTDVTTIAEIVETTSNNSEEPVVEEKTGIVILYTSDIHCGINQGFGLASIYQIRQTLEKEGYATILVDDGDAIQGELIGTLSKGKEIISLMNDLKYDIAIPGNHEFDYGMDNFFDLVETADFPYISCNFNKEGELVFKPYIIKEVLGKKIAFVGVTTPETLTSSTPAIFKNEEGKYIYGFLEDETGEKLYSAVQKAVNDARNEGADYVYVLGHCGNQEACRPWTYSDIIANTNGIDVFLDGHSHDTDQIVMKNKDGKSVVRSACGTKMTGIGYSIISLESGIEKTGIWTWNNSDTAAYLFDINNEIQEKVLKAFEKQSELTNQVVAKSDVTLTIYDPNAYDTSGKNIRLVRRAETNLGDFCTDAIRIQTGADICLINSGGIRLDLKKGQITYGDIIAVFPFNNSVCVIEATGQQILDALEWGARALPSENAAFLQVSGMRYSINTNIKHSCVPNEQGLLVSIGEERRVFDVYIGDELIDPEKTYVVSGINYVLLNDGDGNTAFDGCKVLQEEVKIDNQALIDYITDNLGGVIGTQYEDPYGEGRITIIQE